MAFSFTYDDISKGYEALSNIVVPEKLDVFGQPVKDSLYYARLVYYLILEEDARAGNALAQAEINRIPLAAVKNNTASPITVRYNGQDVLFGAGDIYLMTQNEADFMLEKSAENFTPLVRDTLANFYAFGKPNFIYW